MTRDEVGRSLLKVIDEHRDRDWGSPEKNHKWPELERRIRIAVHSKNEQEMDTLYRELRWFTSPTFVLAERMRRIIEQHESRTWPKASDNDTWKNLAGRAKVALARKDAPEISQISIKIVQFFRARNEHALAERLEKAPRR
jgi:endonuclease YncB( thermonuclease family)